MAYILAFCLVIASSAYSKDFGRYGQTFPIQEENLLDYLKKRLLNASDEEQAVIANKLIKVASQPKSFDLPRASHYRLFHFDPTTKVYADIKDSDGKIIIPKGSSYNPLSQYQLPSALLFFDASQKQQLAWAKANEGTWILVKGNPLKLEQAENRPVYFDQHTVLIKKFGIKALPAKVSQDHLLLKIEEFALEKR